MLDGLAREISRMLYSATKTDLVILTKSELELDGLLESFETPGMSDESIADEGKRAPVAFLSLEGRYLEKLLNGTLWTVDLELFCVVVSILDVDVTALICIVVFVLELIAGHRSEIGYGHGLNSYSSCSESCMKSSSDMMSCST